MKDKRKQHGTMDKHSSEQWFVNPTRLPLLSEKTGALAGSYGRPTVQQAVRQMNLL